MAPGLISHAQALQETCEVGSGYRQASEAVSVVTWVLCLDVILTTYALGNGKKNQIMGPRI